MTHDDPQDKPMSHLLGTVTDCEFDWYRLRFGLPFGDGEASAPATSRRQHGTGREVWADHLRRHGW